MAALRWFFGAAALVSTVATDLVKVRVYGESGCPYTRRYLEGELNQTLAMSGLENIIDFEYVPWGNAYFVTDSCGGAGQYNRTARRCYDTLCGAHATAPAADCFSGAAVCQHGTPECMGNKYQACAKVATSYAGARYMPFVTCVQSGYLWSNNASAWQALSASCAAASHLDFGAITACYEGEAGDREIIASAKATPDHPGVPWVLVDGVPVDMDKGETLLHAICAAHHGTSAPAACAEEAASQLVPRAKALRGTIGRCD